MKKPKKIYLTDHSKERFQERTSWTDINAQNKKATEAFKNGHEFSEYKDPVSSYLKSICSEQGKYVAKIYKEYVYIFNNNHGHRLLTVYPVPVEYIPTSWCLLQKEELGRCAIALTNKKTGAIYYWHALGGLTTDLDEILEFKSQIKAQNYINNTAKLKAYEEEYDIDLF